MSWLYERVRNAIHQNPGDQGVAIVKANRTVPASLPQTVSAFANTDGGLIILASAPGSGFVPSDLLADALNSACSDAVEPSVRAEMDTFQVEGVTVTAAAIPALSPAHRPCFVRAQGIERGSYLRDGAADRLLTAYEIHAMQQARSQPKDDTTPVADATLADLDPELVTRLVTRLQRAHSSIFEELDDATILRMVGALTANTATRQPTLAGLISLGRFPQQFMPQLNISFVSYVSVDGSTDDESVRFLDSQAIDGPAPRMIDIAQQTLVRNMARAAVISGGQKTWEYPLPAFREIVANAIIHRDYHPLAQGTQIRIELRPDRLTVTSPGGLFGIEDATSLTRTPIVTSRNATLARLLEDVELPNSRRTVVEDRGTGLTAVAAELQRAGLPPANVTSTRASFTIELGSPSKVAPAAMSYSRRQPAARGQITRQPTQRQADVLRMLQAGPKPAAYIEDALGISRQAVLKHLIALEEKNLISTTGNRRAKTVCWQMVP